MRCNYPNCRAEAVYTPVITLPTIRTVAMDKPRLHPVALDATRMYREGLISSMAIRQHQQAISEYNNHSGDMVETDRPTYLIGKEVCSVHQASYNMLDWFPESDWAVLREAAKAHGFEIPEPKMVVIQFKPVGWQPPMEYLEMDRT